MQQSFKVLDLLLLSFHFCYETVIGSLNALQPIDLGGQVVNDLFLVNELEYLFEVVGLCLQLIRHVSLVDVVQACQCRVSMGVVPFMVMVLMLAW